MNNKIQMSLSLIVALTTLTSCIGGGVLYPYRANEVDNPEFGKDRGYYYPVQTLGKPMSCAEVIKYWGKPDSTRNEGSREFSTYNEKFVWLGLLVAIVLPIPIAVPVGRGGVTIVCENDKVIQAWARRTATAGAFCEITTTEAEVQPGCQFSHE